MSVTPVFPSPYTMSSRIFENASVPSLEFLNFDYGTKIEYINVYEAEHTKCAKVLNQTC